MDTKKYKKAGQQLAKQGRKTTETVEDGAAAEVHVLQEAEVGTGAWPETILAAINDMKAEISTRFDGVLTAIDGMHKEIRDCTERVTQAEVRISTAEDDVASLLAKVKSLESKNKDLGDKLEDLESRSRRSNLRLIGLPEKAEGTDACTFLERWIPEALGMERTLNLERAHRIGVRKDTNAPPRTMIMLFQSYKEKMLVVNAARAKKQVLFKDQPVRFYPDLSAEVHKQQKRFDNARLKLREIGIRYGMLFPARLLVTHGGQTRTFGSPSEVEKFIEGIKRNVEDS